MLSHYYVLQKRRASCITSPPVQFINLKSYDEDCLLRQCFTISITTIKTVTQTQTKPICLSNVDSFFSFMVSDRYEKTVWDSEKAHGQRRCCESCVCNRCRIVRLGDSRERKKRPHLVKKLNHKSIKEGIQMKQNRIFDQNSSQKARSWHYNMHTS